MSTPIPSRTLLSGLAVWSPILGSVAIFTLLLLPFDMFPFDGGPSAGGARAAFADGDGEGDDPEPGTDLGDEHVPFAKQVNKAIEQGVLWLRAKPTFFKMPGTEGLPGVHYGLVKGQKLYGGGTGPQYRHPAGPTALALYTMLKCGVSPKDHVIVKGFNWLRAVHRVTGNSETHLWDAAQIQGRDRKWNHTIAGSSYELSMMLLALTAKYDAHKKTSASRRARRHGKLKIKDRFDRAWMQQLTTALVARRGQPTPTAVPIAPIDVKKLGNPLKYNRVKFPTPGDLPPRKERLGWRYNVPRIDLYRGLPGGGREGWQRGGSIPPHANQDLSSTNLAALALFSAQRFGMRVPVSVWTDVLAFTLDHQEAEGPAYERFVPGFNDRYAGKPQDHSRGFMYIKGSTDGSEGIATRSMTACGIANLLICREMIAKDKKARKAFIDSGRLKKVDQAIWDGRAWLDVHWSDFGNTNSRYGYPIYHLYCVERAMDLLGKSLIGRRLWYKPGALAILKVQRPQKVAIPLAKNGTQQAQGVYWKTGATHEPKDVLDTCFALLYLKRATRGLAPPAVVTGR